MTPDDAPRTLLDAVVRDLQSAAFDGAMDVALSTTPAETGLRRSAVEAANRAHERDMREEAEKLIAYVAEHFAPGLDGSMLRLDDDRPPLEATRDAFRGSWEQAAHLATGGETPTEVTWQEPAQRFRVTSDNPLADLWRDHLEGRP